MESLVINVNLKLKNIYPEYEDDVYISLIDYIVEKNVDYIDITNVKEITMEANPGEAPRQRLNQFRNLGINRLSIGFQSLQSQLLTSLSRIHSSKDCFKTYEDARNAGFDNINVDMIFNIPGQSLEVFQDDLKQVVEIAPEHISAYSLTVEPSTKLFNLVKNIFYIFIRACI